MGFAITFLGGSTGNTASATAPQCNFPAGVTAGMIAFLHAGVKYPSVSSISFPNFTQLGFIDGGAGASGVNSGQTRTYVFYKICDGTESSATVTGTVTGANIVVTRLGVWSCSATRFKWDLQGYGKAQNTGGISGALSYDVTTTEDIDSETNDWMLEFTTLNSGSSPAITWTVYQFDQTGITFGAATQRWSVATSGGDDLRVQCASRAITAGKNRAPVRYRMTPSSTGSANDNSGGTFILRLRARKRRFV